MIFYNEIDQKELSMNVMKSWSTTVYMESSLIRPILFSPYRPETDSPSLEFANYPIFLYNSKLSFKFALSSESENEKVRKQLRLKDTLYIHVFSMGLHAVLITWTA